MEHEGQNGTRSIDVTGLPEKAIRAVEALVVAFREQASASAIHAAPYEEWVQAFDEWVKSHPRRESLADWSRESIYPGRDE